MTIEITSTRWSNVSYQRARLESDISWYAAGAGVKITRKRDTHLIRNINAYRSEIGLSRTINYIRDLTDNEAQQVRDYYKGRQK